MVLSRTSIVVTALVLAWPSVGRADRYSRSMRAAGVEASQGNWERAADLLGRIADTYPEDYNLHLTRAWYLFQQGDYESARSSYELALKISGGAADARLGLGWCAQRTGDLDEARRQFEAVLEIEPNNPNAAEGLALVRPSNTFIPYAYLFFEKFQGHPWRDYHLGTEVGLDSVIDGNFLLDFGYRYLYIRGLSLGVGTRDVIQQHEAQAVMGFATTEWGLTVHGIYARYGESGSLMAGPGKDSGAVGLSARYTYWADFLLSAAYSFYDDFGVVQADMAVALPATEWLTLSAAFEFQYGDERFWPSGRAEILFHERAWSLALGGSFGTRLRPVDLTAGLIYNTFDRPSGAAWARTAVALGPVVTLHLSYGFERLLSPSLRGSGTDVGYGHSISAGLSLALH
ncbi:MAG: tetratricopeptide repeat protein [Deltaproteobacteria bacterium]|nr:tetratricopeptide repeat protein [Deltaproteobacteria bacterium]